MGAKIPSKIVEARIRVQKHLADQYIGEGMYKEDAATRAIDEIVSGMHNKAIKNCEKILSGRR